MPYIAPKARVHRGFVYLDDETVINSLSAVESGKIDEVVAKINSAREGGFGGKVGGGFGGVGVSLDGSKKSTSALEEEVVRTRTRFSIFELWYQTIVEKKALGSFDGWGPNALEGVQPGDTLELRGELRVVPLQTLVRLFRWFATQAADQNSAFAQKGDELKATKAGLRSVESLLAGTKEVLAILTPIGEDGPRVGLSLSEDWTIGGIGRLEGIYSVVAQVEQVLNVEQEWPTLRLTLDAPSTPFERDTLASAVANFSEPAKALGIDISLSDAVIKGPALLGRPIAVYR